MRHIRIDDFTYELPEERIAKYPLPERDMSRLVIAAGDNISQDVFHNIHNYLEKGDTLVFNDSRVVRARLIMRKDTGATIEVFCLEPYVPIDFERNFSSTGPVRWKCLIGNLRKWKSGMIAASFKHGGREKFLWARRVEDSGDSWIVEFDWDDRSLTFSDIIEKAGRVPIPPYLGRSDEQIDTERYQTVYSKVSGSVAAPTAGLHFTGDLLGKVEAKGIERISVTLHVSAGTFKPVKAIEITDHEMHTEHFYIRRQAIIGLKKAGRVIPVGTTSLRTIESVYWIGVNLAEGRFNPAIGPYVGQWDPYRPHRNISFEESLTAVEEYLESIPSGILEARTSLIIVPGYRFRAARGLITNFHQPRSTLLLLIAAFAGERWRDIYDYALANDFRFLSYGDSSLIIPEP